MTDEKAQEFIDAVAREGILLVSPDVMEALRSYTQRTGRDLSGIDIRSCGMLTKGTACVITEEERARAHTFLNDLITARGLRSR